MNWWSYVTGSRQETTVGIDFVHKVFIDYSKAFDQINPNTLLQIVCQGLGAPTGSLSLNTEISSHNHRYAEIGVHETFS